MIDKEGMDKLLAGIRQAVLDFEASPNSQVCNWCGESPEVEFVGFSYNDCLNKWQVVEQIITGAAYPGYRFNMKDWAQVRISIPQKEEEPYSNRKHKKALMCPSCYASSGLDSSEEIIDGK